MSLFLFRMFQVDLLRNKQSLFENRHCTLQITNELFANFRIPLQNVQKNIAK